MIHNDPHPFYNDNCSKEIILMEGLRSSRHVGRIQVASFRTTPLSAAAAAVQAAQGELEASKLERRAVGALSGQVWSMEECSHLFGVIHSRWKKSVMLEMPSYIPHTRKSVDCHQFGCLCDLFS